MQRFGHGVVEELALGIDRTVIAVTENKELGLPGCQSNLRFQGTVSCQRFLKALAPHCSR